MAIWLFQANPESQILKFLSALANSSAASRVCCPAHQVEVPEPVPLPLGWPCLLGPCVGRLVGCCSSMVAGFSSLHMSSATVLSLPLLGIRGLLIGTTGTLTYCATLLVDGTLLADHLVKLEPGHPTGHKEWTLHFFRSQAVDLAVIMVRAMVISGWQKLWVLPNGHTLHDQ